MCGVGGGEGEGGGEREHEEQRRDEGRGGWRGGWRRRARGRGDNTSITYAAVNPRDAAQEAVARHDEAGDEASLRLLQREGVVAVATEGNFDAKIALAVALWNASDWRSEREVRGWGVYDVSTGKEKTRTHTQRPR